MATACADHRAERQGRQLDRPRPGHQPFRRRCDLAGRQRRERRRRQLHRDGPDRHPGPAQRHRGIRVVSANNRIGGLTPAARNLISGNQGPASPFRTRPRPATSCKAITSGSRPQVWPPCQIRMAASVLQRRERQHHRRRGRAARATSFPATPGSGSTSRAAPTATRSRATSSASTRPALIGDHQRRHRPRRRQRHGTIVGGPGRPGTSSRATAPACRSRTGATGT